MNTDLIVPFAVDVLLKSSAILVFTRLTLQIWGRASAAQRGCVWCVALAIIALLPFTRLVAPHWALSFSKASAPVEPMPVVEPSESKAIVPDEIGSAPPVRTWAMPDGATLGMGTWLAGIFLLLVYRLAGTFLLDRCRRSSFRLQDDTVRALAAAIGTELSITRPVDIRVSGNCRVPVTWGTWRPVVMLPAEALDWPQEWLEPALRHEMGHVKNYDHLKRLGAFLTCAFYWPNPLVWAAAKQMQLAQEEASDNLVLGGGISPQAYSTQLIELIRSTAGRGVLSVPAVAMARPSTLEGRLSAILDDTRNREGADRRLMLAGTGLAMALGLALGAVQLRAAEPAVIALEPPSAAKPGIPLLQEKLKSIVIDKINFDKADIATVIQFLQQKSKELDPDHQGVNFVLRLSAGTPASGAPEPNIHQEVTLALEDVPLGKVLDEITRQTNLQYWVEDYAIYLRPAVDKSETLTVRTYLVPIGFDMTPIIGTKPIQPDSPIGLDVKNQLIARGIIFSDGATATFIPNTRKLIVRNTPKQLDLIVSLFDAWMHPPAYLLNKPAATPMVQPASESGRAIARKLQSIIIDKVNFNKLDIAVILQFLTQKSRELDPDKKGINFILGDITLQDHVHREVSVTLDNVPLADLLGYITQQTNLKWSIQDNAVYFHP